MGRGRDQGRGRGRGRGRRRGRREGEREGFGGFLGERERGLGFMSGCANG